jgi:hypothetical protein
MKNPIVDASASLWTNNNQRWTIIAALILILGPMRTLAVAETVTSSHFSTDASAISVISGGNRGTVTSVPRAKAKICSHRGTLVTVPLFGR